MKLFKIINTDAEYMEALGRSESLAGALAGTPEFEERELLIVLMKDYEYRLVQSAQALR